MSLQRVAIFGATSAIAQAVARQLAAKGVRLHLVGRDPAKLEAVRADIAARGSAGVSMAVADLDETERHAALIDEAEQSLGGSLDAALIAQGTLPGRREQVVLDLPILLVRPPVALDPTLLHEALDGGVE